ncbi:MAG: hypothetical protein Q7S12_02175 [bacterium]|nr:hypothetical protein [bacterium]
MDISLIGALSVNELADFINHLGEGTLEELRKEKWFHHVEKLVPKDINTETVHTLWVLLINVHSERYMAEVTKKRKTK